MRARARHHLGMAADLIPADQILQVAPDTVRVASERAMHFRVNTETPTQLASPAERGRAHPLTTIDLAALRASLAKGHPGAKIDEPG